jgi:hypothetical protein
MSISAPKEQANVVGSTVKDHAEELRSAAAGGVGQVATEAQAQVKNVLSDARDAAGKQVQAQGEQLTSALASVRDQVQALAEGRPEAAGPVADYARQAADQLDTAVSRLQTGGLPAIADDLQRFARRRPGVFLAGAVVSGFLAGRLLRAGKDAGALEQLGGSAQPELPDRRELPEPGYADLDSGPRRLEVYSAETDTIAVADVFDVADEADVAAPERPTQIPPLSGAEVALPRGTTETPPPSEGEPTEWLPPTVSDPGRRIEPTETFEVPGSATPPAGPQVTP